MADKGRDRDIVALEAVYAALKDLDEAARKKVLSSVFALLGLEQAQGQPSPIHRIQGDQRHIPVSASRPVSLVELINNKKPGTSAQRIALFAYYREKSEGVSRFGRDDLELYFAKAKQTPAGNYDRDFVEAVRKGWIHEDGTDSYLTTKGVEAVESGFEGERKYSGRKQPTRKPKPRPRAKK
jgi:hypothetical protein